jgi:dinuclear metal center YbgI/SA1388 family protein
MPQLAGVIAALEEWFEPSWAESWDSVGLTCGDPAVDVTRVVLAVDAVPQTVTEAEAAGAQLLLTHHPLLLSPVHGVPVTDPKGALVHRMIRSGIAHYVAHTNADVADPGVSDALAARLGVAELRPLDAAPEEVRDTLVVFVATDDAAGVTESLIGTARATHAWSTIGVAVRAEPSGRPTQPTAETRIELTAPRPILSDVVTALRPARFDVYPQVALGGSRGTGRLGELDAPTNLREFLSRAVQALPRTVWGIRAAGNPDREVRTVAVCGGSGAPFIEAARRAGADAYVTSDLRHHVTLEAVSERGPDAMALIDAAHWATEAPWLDALADRVRERFGTTVDVTVSRTVTDPWTLHALSPETSPSP